ncbi:23.6 kDa heat shock protein, mitochondrial-like [Oryza brachyantha]|uniref:23.6 kDa heat shock protein, mitochondrial-like n=1 Tax=Oryza brachyantha TaxID=4533 RepID=UPI001AD9D142|nr:23.6 kDa heat shock protein, mitochondrial-like [Oryza brachyantha]
MSTVTSCTFLSGRPAAVPASSAGGRLSKKAAAAVSVPSGGKPQRLSVCYLSPKGSGEYNPKIDLPPFNISAVALVNPMPAVGERWQVEEKSDAVTLWFDVPGLSKEDLAVEIDEDVLVIKKKDAAAAKTAATPPPSAAPVAGRNSSAVNAGTAAAAAAPGDGGRVYARLLLPAGYSREGVAAELSSGELKVTIARVKESARRRINVEITTK